MQDPDSLLRQIPPIDRIMDIPTIRHWIETTSRGFVLDQLNLFLDQLRLDLRSSESDRQEAGEKTLEALEASFLNSLQHAGLPRLGRGINATGVILHTNLGRAPLSEQAIDAVCSVAGGYSNLELDLSTGERGHRDVHLDSLLGRILGCQAATAVNNNAAAVFLVLNEIAAGGEVLVSRGELMEIGGSFRIPEILAKSGASLREVGTTNKTRLTDYQAAISESTRLILKVHPSNYRIVGFSESTPLAELVSLGQQRGLPVVEDAGSGLLQDLSILGTTGEPLITDSLRAGVDLVTFSADKLLGGPQAGIIAGREELVTRIRSNPLMRLLRLDKMTVAALSSTLQTYLEGRALSDLPVLRMISESNQDLRQRATALRRRLAKTAPGGHVSGVTVKFVVVNAASVIGGGSCPGMLLPSWAVCAVSDHISATQLESALRSNRPPILARIEEDRVLFDLRTLLPGDAEHIARFFSNLSGQ
jgi:L-seryl-tRNA(Ser) seleniumtransferase